MDAPEIQVESLIRGLTQSSRDDQRKVLERSFTPNAYFIHPFCRVPSFGDTKIPFTNQSVNSRWLVFLIYQWYHILSPEIKLDIDSTAFDKKNQLLYVTLHQTFTLWFVPFSLWQARVKLVTVLNLEYLPVDSNGKAILDDTASYANGNTPKRYFVKGQEDHYQVEDFVKFVAPWGVSILWTVWQLFATLICAVGVAFLRIPIAWSQQVFGFDNRVIKSDNRVIKTKE